MGFFLFILFFLSPIILLVIYFLPRFIISFFQVPTNNKNWTSLHSRGPFLSTTNKNECYIQNVRNAVYYNNNEWDNKVEWLNKRYILNQITNIYLYVNPYAFKQSHAILSFKFDDEKELCFSFEIRKTHPESFNIFNILVQNYESFYCVGVPEDLIYVRKKIRKHNSVYKFEIQSTLEERINLFKIIANNVNENSRNPKFYRILYRNCISEILNPLNKLGLINFRSRINFFNLPKLLYKNRELLKFKKDVTYKEFLKKSKI